MQSQQEIELGILLPKDVEVGWGKCETGSSTDRLATEGLACCIGIAIFDPSTKIGHLAHALPHQDNHEEIGEQLEDSLQARTVDPSLLRGWVRGGSLSTSSIGHYENGLMLRKRTLEMLGNLGISRFYLDVEWNEDYSSVIHLALDCQTGNVEVEKEDTSRTLEMHRELQNTV